MDSGQLEKVTIQAFKNEAMTDRVTDVDNPFTVPVNPESFTQNFKIKLEESQGQGNQSNDPKYERTPPEELKLDFILDGTGTIEGYHQSLADLEVSEQVDKFLKLVFVLNGNTHKPNYLKVMWGKFETFYCVLKSIDINYTLFAPSGFPLRAKLSCAFTQYKESERRVREEDKSSPDLTHVFTLQAGESLPMIAYRTYNSNAYYREVAAANDLTSFRNVPVNTAIIYPPIKKNTAVE